MVERKSKHSIESVFSFVEEHYDSNDRKKKADFEGDMIKPYSLRYKTFMRKCTTCVCCGMEAQFFVKERHQSHKPQKYNPNEPYHLNLYGVNEEGEEILFTKDHVLAKALGGKDNIDNMQTMCSVCNGLKADLTEEEWANYDHSKTKEENHRAQTYEQVKDRADRYGKKVFVALTLDNRLFISTNMKNAQRKYAGHDIVSYEDFVKIN